MKSTIAVALALLLALPSHPVLAQDTSDSSWTRVQRIEAGKVVALTVRDAQPAARVVIGATDDSLIVLNLSNAALPRSVRSALLDMARRGIEDFLNVQRGATFRMRSGVRIALDGIFVADAKVVDLADVVETIGRADVRMITITRRSRWSIAGAAAGGVLGTLAGLYLGIRLAMSPCGRSCSDEELRFLLALVGLPLAGGILGYKATGRDVVDVIYKAPPVQPPY